jgi:uncharacterized protein (DUF2141 family)
MATVTIRVSGLRNGAGHVRAGLYTNESDWLKPIPTIRGAVGDPRDGVADCVFDDVPVGTYAVAVFHDENDNEKMDLNFLRLPKEGFGFSNVDRMGLGSPSFADASFDVRSGDVTVSARMHYLLG